MKINKLIKDGLTGNSGLGVDGIAGVAFHIQANYASGKGKCFVDWCEQDNPVPYWRRMTVARAKKEERRIILCAHCSRPAISLDHLWPYDSGMNYCPKHRNAGYKDS